MPEEPPSAESVKSAEPTTAPPSKLSSANPFAGLAIDFGAGAGDAASEPLGGNGASNGGDAADDGTSIAFGSPIAFGGSLSFPSGNTDAPAARESRPRAGGPVGGPDDGADHDENRTKLLI